MLSCPRDLNKQSIVIVRKLVTLLLVMVWNLGHSDQGSAEGYETKSGKRIRITETHPVGRSLSNIRISSEGFKYEFDETFVDADPIADVFVADLDGNGFDELYIVTVSAGSGSYGKVIGIASNKDKSMSMIYFPEIEQSDPIFRGYMGHDVFTLENRWLVRSFPVYRAKEINAEPTGEIRRIVYSLKPGEAMWQLKIDAVEPAD